MRSERGIAVVYVSHDLAVVASIADRVAVMYEGRIVEEGDATQVITRPRHEYTRTARRVDPAARRAEAR